MTSVALPQAETAETDKGWAAHLLSLGFAIIAVIAIFISDWADMARMWWDVSTYQHCLFILPISAWLIHQRKDELAPFKPAGWWPGLIGVFGASCLWMLGEAGGIALFRQLGVVLMIQMLVPTILGWRVARALLFPVFYLIFLVPMGEELIPLLQTITAKLSIGLMGISNIPHEVNGVLITTPSGYFEVAEECSGVKFLVAMIAYGALVCNVCFRSWPRRIAFMAASIIVPILANGFRAFATIWIASVVDRGFAKSFDHVVYGWFFFAIVLALLMAMGWKFFDRKVDDPWLNDIQPGTKSASVSPLLYGFAGLAALLVPVAWQASVAAAGQIELRSPIALPKVAGWERADFNHTKTWAPNFDAADHLLQGAYHDADGNEVDLAIALYAWQAEGREIAGYGQGARGPDSDWAWAAESASPRIGTAERITAPGPVSREVVTIYIVRGKATGSAMEVKLETLKSKLLGGQQAALAIIVSAEERDGKPARAAIDRFLTSLGKPEDLAQSLIAQAR